jgi:4-alpha-glucanotransferase
MKFSRASGILLHPTSLPGPYGIGDLGPQAYRWLDFLANTGTKLWQVLPLGPTGYGDSPYQCFSAFAGNPYLINPDFLLEDGLLTGDDLIEDQGFPEGRVDFGRVIPWKLEVLDRAFSQFQRGKFPDLENQLAVFREKNKGWLADFSLFMALKELHGGASWLTWPAELRLRQPEVLAAERLKLSAAVQRQEFRQFLFYRQWDNLRRYANQKGVRIIGDIPIFVASDSADVWAHHELFFLDEARQPTVVAGVPPDYFSPTGQLWGNPLYRWDIHKETGYQWWLSRLRAVLDQVDIVRLDHFRGFAGYWEVSASAESAVGGRWLPGPGEDFFNAVLKAFGDLPIIAEDLGEITPDVDALRDQYELPGMNILVFAFDSGSTNAFLPHHYRRNSVVYTGTHDNDTSMGWYERAADHERDFLRRYLNFSGEDVAWNLIRAAWSSVSEFALAPLQDFLSLDNEARMNYPGRPSGNWTWRMPSKVWSEALEDRIRELNMLYSRHFPTAPETAARPVHGPGPTA